MMVAFVVAEPYRYRRHAYSITRQCFTHSFSSRVAQVAKCWCYSLVVQWCYIGIHGIYTIWILRYLRNAVRRFRSIVHMHWCCLVAFYLWVNWRSHFMMHHGNVTYFIQSVLDMPTCTHRHTTCIQYLHSPVLFSFENRKTFLVCRFSTVFIDHVRPNEGHPYVRCACAHCNLFIRYSCPICHTFKSIH